MTPQFRRCLAVRGPHCDPQSAINSLGASLGLVDYGPTALERESGVSGLSFRLWGRQLSAPIRPFTGHFLDAETCRSLQYAVAEA